MSHMFPFSMNTYNDKIFNARIIIKVTKSKYVEDFLKGNLHMKSFEYFRTIEEKNTRGDSLEGIDATYRNEDFKLEIANSDGVLIPLHGREEGRGNFHNNYIKNANLFSCSGFSLENMLMGDNKFNLDKQFRDFGDKAIVILNVPKFVSMLQKVFENQTDIEQIPNEPYFFRHVEYVPPAYNGRWGVFRKMDTYEWQQELRIGIYRKVNTKAIHYTLRVGSLEDICMVMDTDFLIQQGAKVTMAKS